MVSISDGLGSWLPSCVQTAISQHIDARGQLPKRQMEGLEFRVGTRLPGHFNNATLRKSRRSQDSRFHGVSCASRADSSLYLFFSFL